jgi:ubiquitin carboxyl-terminal hydrolase 7
MEVVRDKMASKAQDLKLYLEVLDPAHEAQPAESKEGQLMIFVKYFDVSDQSLAGIGHFYVHRGQKVGEVIPLINARMNFPENTPLKLYEVRAFTLSFICDLLI